jgi:hypothetical protein
MNDELIIRDYNNGVTMERIAMRYHTTVHYIVITVYNKYCK